MIEFAFPWAFVLIPLPILLWYIVPRAKPRQPAALKVPFFHAMSKLVKQDNNKLLKNSPFLLPFMIWTLMVIALSGPKWVGEPQPLAHKGYNIMMALDLSGSMQINDMMVGGRPVTRLDVVKRAAENFIKERSGDKIGLILFGSRAYLQSPLTYDKRSVLLRVEDATVGLAGKTTSIGDALGLAIKRLQNVPKKGRVIILLTDGANNSGVLQPLKAAELAKDDNIKVYTIGLGSAYDPRAMTGPFMMPNPSADLDEDTLKEVATITQGRYFRATDSQSLQRIYQTINKLEPIKQELNTVRPQEEYYPWILVIALFIFFYWLSEKTSLLNPINIMTLLRKREMSHDG